MFNQTEGKNGEQHNKISKQVESSAMQRKRKGKDYCEALSHIYTSSEQLKTLAGIGIYHLVL